MAERNLLLRVLSAAVALPAVVLLALWREPWGFGLFSLLVAVLALWEYAALTLADAPARERVVLVLLGTAFGTAIYLQPEGGAAWVIVVVLLLGLDTLLGAGEIRSGPARLGMKSFGVFYIGGLLPALPLMHRELPQGSLWVLAALTVTFANDTGAYFVGRAIGRRKLAPAISPGKTVEGAMGGLAAGIGMMFIARATFFPALTVHDALGIGAAAGLLGPAGDLLESLLKRAAGAKDSGQIIPGHGGVLDRIDALLFVGAYVLLHARYLR